MEEYKFRQKAPQIQELLDKTEAMPSAADLNAMKQNMDAMKQMMDTHVMLPANYTADEEGIYRTDVDDGNVYPVIHPDLSTQPSRMPYRFGNQNIYEVLIPLVGLEEDSSGFIVPFNLFAAENKVLHASMFNSETGVYAPVIINKDGSQWYAYPLSRGVGLSPTFDFLRLQYFCNEGGYGSGSGYGESLRIDNVDGVYEGQYFGSIHQHAGGRPTIYFNQDITGKGEPTVIYTTISGGSTAGVYVTETNYITIQGINSSAANTTRTIIVTFANGESATITFSTVQS